MSEQLKPETVMEMIKAKAVKNSLEDLSLYLNEIERIIHLKPDESSQEDNKYKLQVLEQYIVGMNDLFMSITSEGKHNTLS